MIPTKKRLTGAIFTGWIACVISLWWLQEGKAFAMHSSGTLVCSSCHTMHDSEGGSDIGDTGTQKRLLKFSNITDLCLDCHDGDNLTWPNTPDVFAVGGEAELPGGDFNWVVGNDGRGHNVETAAYGITSDSILGTLPPGGTALSAPLTCTSCHDPHGSPTTSFEFRILRKVVNGVDVSANSILSTNADEAVLVLGSANVAMSDTNHNVYRGKNYYDFGMSNWCGACHDGFNLYMGKPGLDCSTCHFVNGYSTNSEKHVTNHAIGAVKGANYGLNYDYRYPLQTSQAGASPSSAWALDYSQNGVFCLSCHRAHASPYADATVWDNKAASGTLTGCNKCHGK